MRLDLQRALAARRASRRLDLRAAFDATSARDWCELVRDIIAIANSGGGIILVDAVLPSLSVANIRDHLTAYVDADLPEIEVVAAERESKPIVALLIGEGTTPMVFDRGCDDAFHAGTLYFRHGAKSEPANTRDIAGAIERRVNAQRRSWLSAVRRVVQPRGPSPSAMLSSEVRDSESPEATPIRVVDDPAAPAYRVVDYDKTHPYRQKELLAAFRERVPGRVINQFDLLVVRQIHETDKRPEFAHKSLFGTRQYSQRFVDWLVEQAQSNPQFFEAARSEYARRRGYHSSEA